jgi:AcrR family transcriptional regulator
MEKVTIWSNGSLPALPAELALEPIEALARAPKRERTRRQLIDAAVRVFCARGVAAATLQEVAHVAEMANATVYNHFTSKDELLEETAVWLADRLCRRIAESCVDVAEGGERMAIGNRRYLWLAEVAPAWAALLLDVAAASPKLFDTVRGYILADLRLGVRQKAFQVTTESAAADLVSGTIAQAMRMIIAGLPSRGHPAAVTILVLVGLGVTRAAASEIVRRPLPPLTAPATAERRLGLKQGAARGRRGRVGEPAKSLP